MKPIEINLPAIADELDQKVENALFYHDLPGLAVAIGTGLGNAGNSGTYFKTAGYKDLDTGTRLDHTHIFHLASVSKLFVSTTLLRLWEEGLLRLEDKLIDHLPWFTMADQRFREITLTQLLSHTAGMPDVKDYHWDQPETDDGALRRYAQSPEVRDLHLLWGPEEGRFAYSNIGYELLGLVIQSCSSLAFEEAVNHYVFQPLSMTDSTMLTFRRDMARVCTPYMKNEAKQFTPVPYFPYNRAHGPSSTLTSNLSDMEKWAKAHLQKTILKPSTYDLAWQELATIPNNGEKIGLAWFRREQKGFFLYGHEGSDDGFRSSFWLCPEIDLFLLVCSNLSEAPVKKISKDLFDFILQRFPCSPA